MIKGSGSVKKHYFQFQCDLRKVYCHFPFPSPEKSLEKYQGNPLVFCFPVFESVWSFCITNCLGFSLLFQYWKTLVPGDSADFSPHVLPLATRRIVLIRILKRRWCTYYLILSCHCSVTAYKNSSIFEQKGGDIDVLSKNTVRSHPTPLPDRQGQKKTNDTSCRWDLKKVNSSPKYIQEN